MWISSQPCRSCGNCVRSRGFTLVELLVVVSIITIITAALLLRQSSFNSTTLLRSLAYSVALSVRQAQVYGTSVFATNVAGSDTFASGYGLYFSSAAPGSYLLFADLNDNGRYDSSPDESVKAFTLNNGYSVSEICAVEGATKACSGGDDTTGSPITALHVLFKRPNPDACFATDSAPTACSPGGVQQYSGAYIQLRSAGGGTRSIVISSTGEVVVQAPGTLP